MRRLIRSALEAVARRNGGDPAYTIAMYAASPRALRRLGTASGLLSHREVAPLDAIYAAQLVGSLAEGCGSCVQIHINMARRAGVSDELIEDLLRGRPLASADAALATRFARAIIGRGDDEAPAREAVRSRWGDKGVVDLTIATQTSRFLSMLKAGFGYATHCGAFNVGDRAVTVHQRAA